MVDERFTFIKNQDKMSEDEMQYWKRRAERKMGGRDSIHMKCLDMGIGIHYEGLSRPYKHLVETLFRAKHLKVVITTATLAMGVNMPARSVVFAGDHPELNPQNYRQMMGRAGRRGYDNIGHVVFCGIRPRKVSYLMTSQLTSLTGHSPTTPSLCLKILQQEEEFVKKNECFLSMNNTIAPTFDPRCTKDLTPQIKRHFRFTLEYLYQFGLITNEGKCRGFGGVASTLLRYEPYNLIFVRLLESRELHKLVTNYTTKDKTKQEAIAKKLLLVVCHVFTQIILPPERSIKPFQDKDSCVSLPELPDQIRRLLNQYDQETISLYQHYTKSLQDVELCKDFQKNQTTLPLSNISFHKDDPDRPENTMMSVIGEVHEQGPSVCTSRFANLSDPQDSFSTVQEIKTKLRDDFLLDMTILPENTMRDKRGRLLRKNAFAYDFYCHEDYEMLFKKNFLRDGLAWDYLKK
eukprot:UN06596